MSRSRPFSIYLLKEGYDASNGLKEDHSLDDAVPADDLPEGASLFVLDYPARAPWWKSYFGVRKPLNQASKGALIFLPVGERCFALSFGQVFHSLKDTSYEYDFGLRVTLNCVDPKKLRSTDVLEPSAARRQRTQVPIASDLTYFDFDRDSTILKSLTGMVKGEYADLIKHATGASSLRISSTVASGELVGLCEKLLELYESETYKEHFREVQNIVPVRDPTTIDQLNGKLLEAFRAKSEELYLTIPDLIDYRDNVITDFAGAGQSLTYDEVLIDQYYEYLDSKNRALNDIGIEELKKHQLRLTDDDGNPRERYSILKSLIFDTSLDDGAAIYHLTEGNWYKVENEFIAGLEAFLDPRCTDLSMPPYNHENEAAYNEAVALGDATFVCLDKTNISPSRQTQIEPCDLYSVTDGHGVFHHIKISTLSAKLSHLFNQGANAVELLKLEQEAVVKLKALISDKAAEETKANLLRTVDDQAFKVVFGIVTHKDKTRKSKNLPLFSRISLRRNMKALQVMSIPVSFGFIDDQSPKSAGKKKQRKKKAGGGGAA